ncbi:hypothetical protein ABZ428_20865 [Micromonospora matsumotoense]
MAPQLDPKDRRANPNRSRIIGCAYRRERGAGVGGQLVGGGRVWPGGPGFESAVERGDEDVQRRPGAEVVRRETEPAVQDVERGADGDGAEVQAMSFDRGGLARQLCAEQ